MRKLKKYIPVDDFDMPKEIDLERYSAVLIRQSDEKADEDHIFSRESQLQLPHYAMMKVLACPVRNALISGKC